MSTIASADFVTETKRIAAMMVAMRTAVGTAYSESGTCAMGADNARTAILALGDAEQINALLPGVQRFYEAMILSGTSFMYGAIREWLKTLDRHVDGINDYCSDEAIRIHYLLRQAMPEILPKYVFPPVTDLGSVLLSGSGAGAFTEDTPVDTDEYGDGLIEIVTESAIGAADITGTVYGYDYDGNAVQADYEITNGTANDTTVAITGTTRFASINKTLTDAAYTGGTAADAWRFQTKVDRSPAGLT